MLSNSDIKKLSKEKIKGQWFKIGLLYLLISVLIGVPIVLFYDTVNTGAMSAYNAIMYIFYIMLTIAIYNVSFKLAKDENYGIRDFFVKPRVYGRTILFLILYAFISLIIMIIVFMIFFSAFLASRLGDLGGVTNLMSEANLSPLTVTFLILTLLVTMVVGIYIELMYLNTQFIILLNRDDLGTIRSMRLSRKLVKGNKWKLFKLSFSFIGWFILSMFTLGILYIWLIPYMVTSYCIFLFELFKEKKEVLEEFGILQDDTISEIMNNEREIIIESDYELYEDTFMDSDLENEVNEEKSLDELDDNKENDENMSNEIESDEIESDEIKPDEIKPDNIESHKDINNLKKEDSIEVKYDASIEDDKKESNEKTD